MFLDLADELVDTDLNGASGDTERVLASNAAVSFQKRLLLGISESDLIEILIAYQRFLFRNRGLYS